MGAGSRVIWWRQIPRGAALFVQVSGQGGLASALFVDAAKRQSVPDGDLRDGVTWNLEKDDSTDMHLWMEAPPATLSVREEVRDRKGSVLRANTYDTSITKENPDDVVIVTVSVE